MIPDDDPLWYDRVEPDEPLGLTVEILMGAFAVVEFVRASPAALFRTLRSGIAVAFQDVEP